jgi:hypothetical protein
MNKQEVFKRDEFTCKKCGYRDKSREKLSIHLDQTLCNICKTFAPENENEFQTYLNDKVDWRPLQAFRKYHKSLPLRTTEGMKTRSEEGKHISRAPFGYNIVNSELIPDEQTKNSVHQIYKAYLNNTSLNQIAKTHGITVNGIKKILKNHAYVGKVKFAGIINQGNHQPILDYKLFNDVQKKFDDHQTARLLRQEEINTQQKE